MDVESRNGMIPCALDLDFLMDTHAADPIATPCCRPTNKIEGICSVADLLWHLPTGMIDRRQVSRVRDLVEGENATVLLKARLNLGKGREGRGTYYAGVRAGGEGGRLLSNTLTCKGRGRVKKVCMNQIGLQEELFCNESLPAYTPMSLRSFFSGCAGGGGGGGDGERTYMLECFFLFLWNRQQRVSNYGVPAQ